LSAGLVDLWDSGIHEKCLSVYCIFVRCNILERLGLVSPLMWLSDIHDRLWRIPSISPKGLDSHFCCIDSKLSVYDELKDAPTLLELAIWKLKIDERTDGNIDMKMEYRIDSLSMVVIIVPYVLSFITDDSEVDNVVDGDDDDDSDGSDWDNNDDDSNGSDLDNDDDGG
jgi:hypothetical protein